MLSAWRQLMARTVSGASRALLVASCVPAVALAIMPGSPIVNKASLRMDSVNVAQAMVTVSLPAELEILRYSPQGQGDNRPGTPAQVQPVQCGGQTYSQANYSHFATGTLPSLPASLPLLDTREIRVGEPLFFQVEDSSANRNPAQQDSISIVVDSQNPGGTNDRETLILRETGVDTGIFLGFINTVVTPASTDCRITTSKGGLIRATYADSVQATAGLVDPYGVVFDSSTGDRLDNVRVRLVHSNSGLPAQVFGDDGAPFPAEVMTGSTFSSGGLTYRFGPGEYRFPYVAAGEMYRLEVDKLPPGFVVPSQVPDAAFASLQGGPYAVVPGSRRDDFFVPAGEPLRVDLPADKADKGLFVVKSVARNVAAVGDVVPYDVQVSNTLTASTLTGVTLGDRLPVGFRYRSGTFRLDGRSAGDPQISTDGRSLTFALGDMAAAATVRVSYVAEVTAATPLGDAVNLAQAQSGAVSSNTSQASVTVREDLMRSRAILMGRVFETESCEAGNAKPLANVRLYMEDGRYVITDRQGKWHLDNIRPGTHVVQLDKPSLPAGTEILNCAKNTRTTGNGASQFVDVQGGTLWQVDFHLRRVKPLRMTLKEIQQKVSTRLVSESISGGLRYSLTLGNTDVDLGATSIDLTMPQGLLLTPGSLRLNGEPLDPVLLNQGRLTLSRLPARAEGNVLSWDMALAPQVKAGTEVLSAKVATEVTGQPLEFAAVENRVGVEIPEKLGKVIVFRPRFGSFSTELAKADKEWLRDVADDLRSDGDIRLEVVGHTDNVRVVPRKGRAINDNYALSAARAQSVADYLRSILKLDAEHVKAIGKGPDEPLADNKTDKGRESNRRVELKVYTIGHTLEPRLTMLAPDSGEQVLSSRRWIGVEDAPEAPKAAEVAGDAGAPAPAPAVEEVEAEVPEDSATGILSHKDGDVLADRVQAVRVRLDARLKPILLLDGVEIPADRLGFKKDEGRNQLLSFVGVDFGEPGPHELTLKGTDPFNNPRVNQTLKLMRAGDITRIRSISVDGNVADGKTPVSVHIELLDGSGKTVAASTELKILSGDLTPLVAQESDRVISQAGAKVPVSPQGIVHFSPVSRSGLYTVTLSYNNAVEKIQVYVKPEKRDWILVGLTEGSLAAKTLGGNMENLRAAGQDDNLWQDGRVAFFAKGQVKGDWLLTLAYDSARDKKQPFGQVIDPNQYYTLYADATDARYDAPSRENLFLRIEKDAFFALFGDYSTGMTETELSRYSRTLSGLKTEYHDSRFDVNLFAADTAQAYLRRELRGDGTSGIYRLGAPKILPSSEKIRIEVRDRIKQDVVLKSQGLARFSDYSIDYDTGEIFFKSPVLSQDENFNPIFIVAEFEVESNGDAQINAGGRAAVKFLDSKATVGVSLVKSGAGVASGELQGLDAEYKLNGSDTLRAEVAQTDTEDFAGQRSGGARLLEWKRDSNKLKGRVYYKEQEKEFGLGQQSTAATGLRSVGAEGRYQINQRVHALVDIFQQENLNNDASRQVTDLRAEYTRDRYAARAGLRVATDAFGDGTPDRHSDQLTLGGRYDLLPRKLSVRAAAEVGLNGKTEAQDFPDRVLMGVDYKLSRQLTLNAEQEFSWSEKRDTTATRAGAVWVPWKGASFGSHLERQLDESGERLLGTLGLGQRISLTPEWTMDASYDQAQTLKDDRSTVFNPAATPAFGTSTADFWAVGLGGTYQQKSTKGTLRAEHREADDEMRWNLVGGLYRELDPELAIAGGLLYTSSDRSNGAQDDKLDLRWSLAWRPNGKPWIILNRTDVILDNQQDKLFDTQSQRLVNNFNLSHRFGRNQLSFQYGAKFALTTVGQDKLSGYTDLLGVEWRRDLNERWDVGVQTSMLHSWEPGVIDYSYGVSAGYTPVENTWVSLGYNFEGMKDGDFSAAEYTAQGIYLKLRAKIDQDSLAQIWQSARNGVFR